MVAELEVDGILPHQFDLSELESIRDMNRQNDALACHLILAGRARTKTAEQRGEMACFMAVRPQNLNFARAQFLDFGRCGGIRCHAYSTSSTGSAENARMLT
jgi:hypothetical protein